MAQKCISARRKRTELFESEIFKRRKGKYNMKNDNFGYKGQSFNTEFNIS
jgi:hypothetical protein